MRWNFSIASLHDAPQTPTGKPPSNSRLTTTRTALHEALLQLFRNRPSLAPELLQSALNVEFPRYTEARIHSPDLTEVRPVEYRADLVVQLLRDKPVIGIAVEVQLSPDARKRYVSPAYAVI